MRNQLIILETNNEKEPSIYSAFIWTILPCNQIDEGKVSLFKKHIKNKWHQNITILSSPTNNGFRVLSNNSYYYNRDHQTVCTSQWMVTPPLLQSCQGIKSTSAQTSGPSCHLQDIQRREDRAERYHSNAISRLQTLGHAPGQRLQVLHQISCKEKKRAEGKYVFLTGGNKVQCAQVHIWMIKL